MSLSNIFREPRREITESAIGLAIFGLALWGDYELGVSYHEAAGGSVGEGMLGGAILAAFVIIATTIVAYTTHALGEWICNRVEDAGIHLRPRVRK